MLEPNFIPFPELTTDRLILRSITLADANEVFLLRSSPQTMKFLDKEPLHSIAEAELLVNKIINALNNNEGITWGISFKENPGLIIGSIGFWRIMKEHFRAEIGYMLLPEYCKKGIMKEALLKVIDYGFDQLKLHSIEANINPSNIASAALLTGNRFIKEAYFKENFYFDGHFLDSEIYSLINNEKLENLSRYPIC